MASAIEATAADQPKAIDIAATQIPGWTAAARPNAEAVLQASIDLMDVHDGTFGPALDATQWAQMAEFLQSGKLIKTPVTATDAFTNTFAM